MKMTGHNEAEFQYFYSQSYSGAHDNSSRLITAISDSSVPSKPSLPGNITVIQMRVPAITPNLPYIGHKIHFCVFASPRHRGSAGTHRKVRGSGTAEVLMLKCQMSRHQVHGHKQTITSSWYHQSDGRLKIKTANIKAAKRLLSAQSPCPILRATLFWNWSKESLWEDLIRQRIRQYSFIKWYILVRTMLLFQRLITFRFLIQKV